MSYLRFIPGPPKPNTSTWDVTISSGLVLGTVKWFSSWRKYCFFPLPSSVYEEDCLREIALFCETQTLIHKRL